jgi:hypothetical protein
VNVGLTAVPAMTMTYVSDVYLPVNADALTLVVGLKVSAMQFGDSRIYADVAGFKERCVFRLLVRTSTLG